MVGYEPDYSKCTLDELLDVRVHINRKEYPERALRVDEEIAMRRTAGSQPDSRLSAASADVSSDQDAQMESHLQNGEWGPNELADMVQSNWKLDLAYPR